MVLQSTRMFTLVALILMVSSALCSKSQQHNQNSPRGKTLKSTEENSKLQKAMKPEKQAEFCLYELKKIMDDEELAKNLKKLDT